jgi:molybdopterin-guanine dinucleotide biosynthesis protein A
VTAAFDAVVLAGGRGERLGGATKPEVEVGGRALVDHVLAAVESARAVVLVAPPEVARVGVVTVLEDPPDGGPVAGLAAGLAALPDDGPQLVAVLACDVPLAGRALPELLAAASAPDVDGARLVAPDGSAQPLVAVYRRDALTAALAALETTRHESMRRALAGLRLADVPDEHDASHDADTWDDVANLRRAPWWHDRS